MGVFADPAGQKGLGSQGGDDGKLGWMPWDPGGDNKGAALERTAKVSLSQDGQTQSQVSQD